MEIKGSLTAKSIISAGLRVNEGCNTQTLLGDTSLSKYSKKTQYYFTQQDCIVTLPDATTLPTGWTISFFSNKLSSGTVFIHDTAGIEQYKVKPNKSVSVILLENTTAAGLWRVVESGSGTGAGDRNITILSEDPLFAVEGTAVNVNRFVASVSNGFEEDGTAIEEIIEFPGGSALTNPESFPKTSYVYLTIEGMLIQEDKKQDGGNEFPESPEEGDIFYNKQLRKNFKYETSEWVDYPCVAVGEVTWSSETEISPTVYTFNDWWWDYVELAPLVSHMQQFINNTDVTTQITLDTKCLDKNYLTINVGNTVLLSDTYDLASDGVTVSFINAIEAGVKIEAKWYIPISAVAVTTTGANTDLSNLTAVGNEKLLPMGGNIGDVVIRTAEGARWAATTGMTIGTVFISDLVAPYNPPGALEYNGTEVTNADQQYPEFWNTWLTAGKFATGTYAQYADAIAANGGTCPFYAIDVAAKKFKTPTWADGVFPSSAVTSSEVNAYKPAGLPNITASTEGLAPCANPTGAFSTEGGGFTSLDGNANWGTRLKFDAAKANSIYGASTTVQPVSVRKRWFVQVSNAVETSAYQNIDIALNSKVNKSGDTMTGRLSMGANDILFQNPDGGSLLQIATDGNNWDIRGDATWLRFNPSQFGLTLRDMLGEQDFYKVLDSKTVKDYIVERYSDETGNWYEVYASGWIKQGGLIPSPSGTITFFKPYTKIPLNVNMQIIQALSGSTGLSANWFNCTTILDRSKTGFNYGSANGSDIKRMWFAEGI